MCFYILCCKITNFRRKDKGFYTGANVFFYTRTSFFAILSLQSGIKNKKTEKKLIFSVSL